MSLRSDRARKQGAIMRRMSSFGGARIFIPPAPVAGPLGAEPELDDSEHHAPSSNLRWAILLLTCLLLFGNYYAYDNPAALNTPLREYLGHDYDTWQYELNLMYAVYSFPNMFLPFIGGTLVDRLDVKKVLLFFSVVVCLGQTLFAVGVSVKNFPVMLIGRVLFGIGGESIGVVQASITTAWFRGKELAFALGLNLCIARFGSVVNANLSPRIEKIWTSSGAVWVGGLTCYLSLGCSIVLVSLIAHHSPAPPKSPTASERRSSGSEDTAPLLHSTGSNSSLPDPLLEKGLMLDPDEQDVEEDPGPVSFRDVLEEIAMFPWAFWLICLICVLLYGTVVPFNNIASDLLMSKWYPGDTQTAGTVMSIPDTMSALLVPICGMLVDRYGGRASLLVACALVIAGVHTTLGLTYINPVYPLVFLGLSYSMYGVAIWPSIATIIQHREDTIHEEHPDQPPPKLLGTAYGLSTSALNTALTVMPLISAQIRVWGGSFVPVELFFVGLALAGAAASTVLWIVDVKNGSLLQHAEITSDSEDEDGFDDAISTNAMAREQKPLLGKASARGGSYGAELHMSPTDEPATNPMDSGSARPRVQIAAPGETPSPPAHRRTPKYANQPFKPGKAFLGAAKVKARPGLNELVSDTSPPGSASGEASGAPVGVQHRHGD
ncbi:major facilitator superfamily domain-containing protein [Geranomyces variabilis]|nr:major facilitator superfamily domain-containing protein [Geranomyces variabilis]KAJ3141596.1 hypothetical protein HDU90_005939 [Geranomyces variabilis]